MEMAANENFGDWRQRLIAKLARDRTCPYTPARILLYLASVLDPGKPRVVTHAEIMREVGISMRTNVSDALKKLEDKGYIRRHLSREDGRSKEIEILPV
jgi:DNA-binding MarR family transcriptional regulator